MGTWQDMKHSQYEEEFDVDLDDLGPGAASHLEHLTRKWAEDEQRHNRQIRRGLTRRRIEDWREERALQREMEDDYDLD